MRSFAKIKSSQKFPNLQYVVCSLKSFLSPFLKLGTANKFWLPTHLEHIVLLSKRKNYVKSMECQKSLPAACLILTMDF